jgi:hypothetical protein
LEVPIGVRIAYQLNELSFSFDASNRHAFWRYGRDMKDAAGDPVHG